MRTKMKALIKDGSSLAVRSVIEPRVCSDDQVVVRVELAGLCRTDMYVAEGRIASPDPLILGHEFSGTVVACGDSVDKVKVGERVTVNPLLSCRRCAQCSSGSMHTCQNTEFIGIDLNGCFAELVVIPAHAVFAIPDTLSFFEAAYAEPVAASLAVLKTGIEPSDKGLIIGNNRFSQLLLKILAIHSFSNVTVCGADRIPEDNFDFVVETSLAADTVNKMIAAVRPGGKVILKSRHFDSVCFGVNAAIRKEPVIHIVNYGSFDDAIALLASGALTVGDLVDGTYKLEDFQQVFARSKATEALKPFFAFGEG